MLSYQTYKVIHLASIFIFLSGAAVLLLARPPGKAWKVLTGVASLFVLIAGFGLLARLGLTGGLPTWVLAKLAIWAAVTALGHIVAKRFPGAALKAYWITLGLATVAAYLAINKP
jgi:uncharacterized membrane protein SirB2